MKEDKPDQTWQTALNELKLQVTSDIYEMYLRSATLLSADGDRWIVAVPNQFAKDWLQIRLDKIIRRTLRSIAGREIETEYVVLTAGGQQAAPIDDGSSGQSFLRPGELRQAGFVPLWHDLRNLYGPMIGYTGIGVWAELRAHVNGNPSHPLVGHAWPGVRSLFGHVTEGSVAINNALRRLKDARLIDWVTGVEMAELWERSRIAGVPDSQNQGIAPAVLRRLFQNPAQTRIYTVSDPVELPAFCCLFDLAIGLADGKLEFVDYNGRISDRWQGWLLRIMQANDLETITASDFRRMGLA